MSTRSIAIVPARADTHICGAVYIHSDGYPEGVGATLREHYTDHADALALVRLRAVSTLGASPCAPAGGWGGPEAPHFLLGGYPPASATEEERNAHTDLSRRMMDAHTFAYHRDRGDVEWQGFAGDATDCMEYGAGMDAEFAYLWTPDGWQAWADEGDGWERIDAPEAPVVESEAEPLAREPFTREDLPKAETVSAVDAAKIIRARLKAEYPGVRFSVRKERGSGSLRITWTDGPTEEDVKALARLDGQGFDGMIDLRYYKTHWLMPDGSVTLCETRGTGDNGGSVPAQLHAPPSPDARRVAFSTSFVFFRREQSDEARAAAVLAAAAHYRVPTDDDMLRVCNHFTLANIARAAFSASDLRGVEPSRYFATIRPNTGTAYLRA